LASGFFHACGLDVGGRAWCWGDNQYRQVGMSDAGQRCDEVSTCALRPVAVETELRFAAVTAGVTYSCALAMEGAAYCWGGGYGPGDQGILGDGQRTRSARPVAVAGGLRFKTISAGGRVTCAIATDDRGYCWGLGGHVGDGGTADALVPTEVAGGHRFASVAAGVTHACGVTTAGAAYCWGSNEFGQVGTGRVGAPLPARTVLAPMRVASSSTFRTVTAGGDHTCGLTTDGDVVCWGRNHVGQTGAGAAGDAQPTPRVVAGAGPFVEVAVGTVHTCALRRGGAAACWGGNWFGGIGDGTSTAAQTGAERPTPTPVRTGLTFVRIAPGGSHTCALAADGRVWCWGDRARGQMGDA
jgi:alpha-tubulin suppressor-like RCC1 family protein